MAVAVKLGRKPAVADARVPFFHALAAFTALPPPPAEVNYYADVDAFGMLGNDEFGDCVEAMAGHAVDQFTSYADKLTEPTTAEALALYTAITGFNPADPSTDNGTVVMGPGGLVEYWTKHGVTFGGRLNKIVAPVQLAPDAAEDHLRQAIKWLGGIGFGINLPEAIVSGDTVPYVWDDPTGPLAGGHEIWACGYQGTGDTFVVECISWGQRVRLTKRFILGAMQEMVAFYDPAATLRNGLDPSGFDPTEIVNAADVLRAG